MNSMVKEYGEEKAKEVFYASINNGKEGSEKWHKKSGDYSGDVVSKAKEKMDR